MQSSNKNLLEFEGKLRYIRTNNLPRLVGAFFLLKKTTSAVLMVMIVYGKEFDSHFIECCQKNKILVEILFIFLHYLL